MIRVVTFEPLEPKALDKLKKTLYTAFGVGCEHSGDVPYPPGMSELVNAEALLKAAPKISSYSDDKVLYVTARKLKDRTLASGVAPTPGFCFYDDSRALVTTHGVKDLEESKLLGRHAMHQIGHLWQLHHCLDHRCSMYPPWTNGYETGDTMFCNFCRDKSEQKIRLAKS